MRTFLYATTAILIAASVPALAQNNQNGQQGQSATTQQGQAAQAQAGQPAQGQQQMMQAQGQGTAQQGQQAGQQAQQGGQTQQAQGQQTQQAGQQPAQGQQQGQAQVTVTTVPANQNQQGQQQAQGQQAQGQQQQAAGQQVQVAQQCMTDIQAYGTELYSGQTPVTGVVGREFETLRDAALTFARLGDEQACQMVLARMRDVYTTRSQGFNAEQFQTGRTERATTAVPVSQFGAMLSMDELQDKDVIGADGRDLGEVKNVIINPQNGSIQYVLLSTGGWFNTNYIPVRFQDLRITADGDDLVLPITRQALDAAPKVDYDTALADANAWAGNVNNWWDQSLAQVQNR